MYFFSNLRFLDTREDEEEEENNCIGISFISIYIPNLPFFFDDSV